MSPTILLLAFISATLPILAWFAILRRKNRKGMRGRFLMAFILASIGGLIFTLIQSDTIGFLTRYISSFFLVFLLIGLCIEYFINFMVRIAGFGFFRSVDDVIDLSFAAALGFTFSENLIAFSLTFSGNNPDVIEPVLMLKYFLIREFFILPIHLFAAGLFGYFYGIALFASQELQENNKKDFFFRLYTLLFFFIPKSFRFKTIKIAQGTTLSVLSYSIFFSIYHKNYMVSDVFHWLGIPSLSVDEQLILLIAFLIFKGGTILFFNLMDKKRRWSQKGLLIEK